MALFRTENAAILRMVKFKSATVLGVSTIEAKIPGIVGSSDGRYVDGGEGWFEGHHLEDFFCVCIVDNDNIMGLGAGAVVGSYTEQGLTLDNEGWFIPLDDKNVTVKALSGFGWIPSGLYLKITATKGDLSVDTFRMNLAWGVKDVG